MEDMQGIIEYIEKYGKYSFKDFPINELDALIFSQLVYIDYEGIVENNTVFLADSAMKYFALHTDEETQQMLGIASKAVRLLMLCAKSHRFGYVGLSRYVNYVNDDLDKQFAAVHFKLDREHSLVAFRGTDATVTGIKESAMLSYMFPVPAQVDALHYFQETVFRSKGKLYICGHSKGGNLAVFTGVSSSNLLKKRIAGIYEFDAPGFPDWFFDRHDYKQIEDRIFRFAPEGSVVGRMLMHRKNPVIVESINSGLKQHQVSSWVVDGAGFKTMEEFNPVSDFVSEYINSLIKYVGEDDLELFFDTIEYVLDQMDIEDIYDMRSINIKRILKLIDSVENLDDAKKEDFKLIVKKASSDFARAFLHSKYKSYRDIFRKE